MSLGAHTIYSLQQLRGIFALEAFRHYTNYLRML